MFPAIMRWSWSTGLGIVVSGFLGIGIIACAGRTGERSDARRSNACWRSSRVEWMCWRPRKAVGASSLQCGSNGKSSITVCPM